MDACSTPRRCIVSGTTRTPRRISALGEQVDGEKKFVYGEASRRREDDTADKDKLITVVDKTTSGEGFPESSHRRVPYVTHFTGILVKPKLDAQILYHELFRVDPRDGIQVDFERKIRSRDHTKPVSLEQSFMGTYRLRDRPGKTPADAECGNVPTTPMLWRPWFHDG